MKKEDIIIAYMIGLTHIIFAIFAQSIQTRMIFPGYAGLFFLFACVYLIIYHNVYNTILFIVATLSLGSMFFMIFGTNYAWHSAELIHRPLHAMLGVFLFVYASYKTYRHTQYLFKDVRKSSRDFPSNRDVYDPCRKYGPRRKYF